MAALARAMAHERGAPERAGTAIIPRATYRVQLHREFTLRARPGAGALSGRPGREPSVLLAVPARARRQPARLRHRRPPVDQSGDRHAAPTSMRLVAELHRHGLAHADRRGAQPHGRAGARQRLVARRARVRRGVGVCRVLRHRLASGRPEPARPRAAADSRRPIRPGAGARRSCAFASTPPSGSFPRALPRPPAADRSVRLRRSDPRRAARSCDDRDRRTGAALRELAGRVRPSARPRRRRRDATQRRSDKRVLQGATGALRGRHAVRSHRRVADRLASIRRCARASTRSMRCSRPRPTGWRTGAWPPTRSTTGASSTSTSWRRCAWTAPTCSRRRTRWCCRWRPSGAVDGLRIDHRDGLADPAAYFRRLQQRFAELSGSVADGTAVPRPLYVVTEKITAPHERLPTDWAVHGTTGYRFANVVNGLLVDCRVEAAARPRVARLRARRGRRLRRAHAGAAGTS